jgi:hypothetical protein
VASLELIENKAYKSLTEVFGPLWLIPLNLRRSRYIGLARTHLQQLLNATAMNVVWVIAWLWGKPLGERKRKPGHFAQLAPHPLSRQTVLC